MDGYKSRENPVALKILKNLNIDVFIIPSHSSHLTQLFDVGIASPLKACFSDILKSLMINFKIDENNTGQIRLFCIKAAIMSFDIKTNKKSCLIAAELTGLNPINNENLLNSNLVSELTPEIERFIKQKRKLTKKD